MCACLKGTETVRWESRGQLRYGKQRLRGLWMGIQIGNAAKGRGKLALLGAEEGGPRRSGLLQGEKVEQTIVWGAV